MTTSKIHPTPKKRHFFFLVISFQNRLIGVTVEPKPRLGGDFGEKNVVKLWRSSGNRNNHDHMITLCNLDKIKR